MIDGLEVASTNWQPARWLRRGSAEYKRAWGIVEQIFGSPVSENHDSGEAWQYLKTSSEVHEFRHRDLPPRAMIRMREQCRRTGVEVDPMTEERRELFAFGDTQRPVIVTHQRNGRTYCNIPAR